MAEAGAQTLQFRPRARIIRTIGDQLISGPEAAVIELVKNAYDADASFVAVKFVPPLEAGKGRIIVTDDGHGMSLSDIQEKWMEPATSSKLATRRSPAKNRAMMGSKGIGRFAAAKLGRRMGLISISDRDGERRAVLIPRIDWSIFSGDAYLSDISIDYLGELTTEPTGTTIEIDELNEPWSEAKLSRLHLELRRLISPLQSPDETNEFRIFLDLSECTPETCGFDGASLIGMTGGSALSESVSPAPSSFEVRPFPLLTACDYEVVGQFDDVGQFHGSMEIRRGGQAPQSVVLNVPATDDEEKCGTVGVHLFLFDREADAIKQNMKNAGLGDLTATEARQILDNIAGIAIYRDGFRIRPYGDAANDWLTLDRRRVQDPSLRIGHNQVAGYITVEQQDGSGLIEKSSREGFEENAAFNRLHRLIRELLSQVVEPRRQQFRAKAGISRSRTTTFDEVRKLTELEKIRKVIETLEPEERATAEKVIDQQSTLLSEKIDLLEERQRVLEAKSSLGLIIGHILHEGAPMANYVALNGNKLARFDPLLARSPGERSDKMLSDLAKKLPLIANAGARLTSLFDKLRPLAGGKRGNPQFFNPVNVLRGARDLFSEHGIPITINSTGTPDLLGYPEDLTTAAVNLFGNAVYWLDQARTKDPVITVHVSPADGEVIILIDDNGPGIPSEFAEAIFDVGFTLKEGGTGLGLNIAHEALARSLAKLIYHLEYDQGTRFEIRFPTR